MNQELIIILIFFFLFLLALAVYTKSTGGLFLARIPGRTSDFQPTEQNKTERQAGLAFVAFSFKLSAVALPLLLFLYDSLITKLIGGLIVVGIAVYLYSSSKSV